MAKVSKDAVETTLQLYANPLLIQDKQLSLFESHVFGGNPVLDGNNVFTFGLEMDATMTASIVNEMTNNFQSLYPSRAMTMSDLYRHLSDYDYIDMFSTPSTTTIELMMDRNFLINNAPVNELNPNENIVVIPSFSKFTVGEHTFGIHYPIKITIRKAYKTDGSTIDYDNTIFQCAWDTTLVNPLYRLTSNVLEHREYQRDGIHMLCVSIPVQQFKIDIKKEDTVASTGFIKRYPYSDKFYAIRVFHSFKNTWIELSETLSDVVYNASDPTVNVKVLSDIHTLEVSIPQIYFTKGMIGNRIMCVIYTTEGALDIDIRNYNASQFGASFLIDDKVEDDRYSAFLKRMPLLQVVPLSSRISNGSNGKTFEEMKNRVINSVGGDDLLVTTQQISAHLQDMGFRVSKYLDNITNRIYIASKLITDADKNVIGSGEYKTTIADQLLKEAGKDKRYDTIYPINRNTNNREFVIMPNTVFKYSADTDSMIPLDRYEIKHLFQDSTTKAMITELNNNIYTFTPFHIKLNASAKLPMAGVYDLLKPSMTHVTFVKENTGTITQVSMFGGYIEHKAEGTQGYRLTIALYTTNNLAKIPVLDENGNENIVVILRTKNTQNDYIYLKGKYIGNNSDDRSLIMFDLDTNYSLSANNTIDSTSFTLINDAVDLPNTNYIELTQQYELLFFVKHDLADEEEAITQTIAQTYIPKIVNHNKYTWLATQSCDICLGKSISTLMTNTFVTITGEQYATYASTEYAAYAADIYARYEEDVFDKQGNLLHYAGDLKTSNSGDLVIDHKVGDLILTNNQGISGGLRLPAYSIMTLDDTDNSKLGSSVETLYMSNLHQSAIANSSNIWLPFRINKTNDDVFETIYTGSTQQLPNGIKTSHTASITEIKDLLKLMIDNCYLGGDKTHNTGVPTSFESKRIRTTFDIHGNVLDRIGYTYDVSTKTYKLTNDVMPYNFIYVDDASADTRPSPFIITKENNKYKLHGDAVTINGQIERNSRPADWGSTYGALYRRDSAATTFKFTEYISESNLCKFYEAMDSIEHTVNYDAKKQTILKQFNLDTQTAALLEQFRSPWLKVIEVKRSTDRDPDRGFGDIVNYWNTRSYMNFNESFSLITHNSSTPVSGVLALRYIQDRTINIGEICIPKDENNIAITTINSVSEKIINADNQYRLYWISNYNPDADTTRIGDEPLITELPIKPEQTQGALLWSTHSSDTTSSTYNKHYLVISGPSKEDCYNYLMSRNMLSGYAYVTKVYDVSSLQTQLKSFAPENLIKFINPKTEAIQTFNNEIEAETSIRTLIESCPNLYDFVHMCTSTLSSDEIDIRLLSDEDDSAHAVVWGNYWPWETSNWLIIPQQSKHEYAGQNINALHVQQYINTRNSDANILHAAGDVQLTNEGTPVENTSDGERKLVYHINTIQCDYKLLKSSAANQHNYRLDVQELLRSYFDVLTATKPQLLERTELYYSPIKSMGYGKFKGTNSDELLHPLEITVDLRVHVSPITAASDTTKAQIRTNIISIVEKHIANGNIACAILANEIRNSMSDTVLYVDVLGINGDSNIQTLISTDNSKYSVRLKTLLELDSDGSIQQVKGVNIVWAILK